jgi:hypothetical protein
MRCSTGLGQLSVKKLKTKSEETQYPPGSKWNLGSVGHLTQPIGERSLLAVAGEMAQRPMAASRALSPVIRMQVFSWAFSLLLPKRGPASYQVHPVKCADVRSSTSSPPLRTLTSFVLMQTPALPSLFVTASINRLPRRRPVQASLLGRLLHPASHPLRSDRTIRGWNASDPSPGLRCHCY